MTQERLKALTPQLVRRMALLALLNLSVMGGLAPWLYERGQHVELQKDARFMARTIASRLRQLVARDHVLWAYRPQEISQVIKPFQELGAQVRCQTAQSVSCGVSFMEVAHARDAEPLVSAHHPIMYRMREFGWVSVTLATPVKVNTINIWLIALPLALLVSSLILALPWGAAASADQINISLWRRLIDLNQTLEVKVQERTLELSEMNQRLLTVQEEERSRMSRDLHDELGQTLTGLRLHLTRAEILNQADHVDEVIKQALTVIDLGVDQVRRIAYEQRPPELDMLGLYEALSSLVKRADDQSEVRVTLEVPSAPPSPLLTCEMNVSLFRIAQEGITNALRHSGTDRVEVVLSFVDHDVMLCVIDRGQGQLDQLVWGGGLSGAYGRLHRLGGTLQILPTDRGGLTVMARIPLNAAAPDPQEA